LPQQREELTMVKSCAESLLAILNDILDFSKIESGKLDFETVPFGLRETLAEAMSTLGFSARKKGLQLTWEVADEAPETLAGDPGRLRQVIVNLVGNAIKFTEQGKIALRVELQSQDDHEARLHFAVSDTGIGIPPDKQE